MEVFSHQKLQDRNTRHITDLFEAASNMNFTSADNSMAAIQMGVGHDPTRQLFSEKRFLERSEELGCHVLRKASPWTRDESPFKMNRVYAWGQRLENHLAAIGHRGAR
jgi:hypothetical protein